MITGLYFQAKIQCVLKKGKEESMIFFYVIHPESVRIEIRTLAIIKINYFSESNACNNAPWNLFSW